MITQKEMDVVRDMLIKYNSPLFFFDNDVDGLSSFLLLRRFCGKGKGVAIKSFPDLSKAYSRKLYELRPDCIFILDKPLVSKGFLDKAKELNLPVVWVDHHAANHDDSTIYLNPLMNKPKSSEPVSYWAYKITKNKSDDWVSFIGCLADWYIPDFAKSIAKKFPDLISEEQLKSVGKSLYESKFGFIIKLLSFGLKDRTSNVVNMLKFLIEIQTPYEILKQNTKTKQVYHRFNQINRHYTKLIQKAKTYARSKLLFFQYGGSLSLSAELSNELYYNFPDKVVVVAYLKGEKANVSIRGNINVRDIVLESIKDLDASGGGHEHACGATIKVEDLPLFKERIIRLMPKIK